jgi:hypothetical protein
LDQRHAPTRLRVHSRFEAEGAVSAQRFRFGRGKSAELLAEQTPAFAIEERKYRLSADQSVRQWNAAVVEHQLASSINRPHLA